MAKKRSCIECDGRGADQGMEVSIVLLCSGSGGPAIPGDGCRTGR